jgi:hypothetical protein
MPSARKRPLKMDSLVKPVPSTRNLLLPRRDCLRRVCTVAHKCHSRFGSRRSLSGMILKCAILYLHLIGPNIALGISGFVSGLS